MRDKEARFCRHENHCVSKRIVESARRTDRGIALEDLEGIGERVTARGGDGRHRLKGWAFDPLRCFIEYKAKPRSG
jgi:IS605 OrfB family transposase